MAEKNVKINVKTSSGYDTLYPQTKGEIVKYDNSASGLSSTTVEGAIDELKDSLYRPNLLINGDFQCWQRGEDTPFTNCEGKYTADMWMGYGTTVYIGSDSEIVCSGSYNNKLGIKQFVPLTKKYYLGKKVTLVIYAKTNLSTGLSARLCIGYDSPSTKTINLTTNVQKFEFTVTLSENHFYQGRNFVYVECPYNSNISNSSAEIRVYSVDLFEGDISYPHSRESYAIAINRCQEYIFRSARRKLMVCATGGTFVQGFNFPVPMEDNPTYQIVEFKNGSGASYISNIDTVSVTKTGLSYVAMTGDQKQPFFQGEFIFTCEPLL